MIGGLLRLSRAGKVTDEFAPVDLADLVAVVAADLRDGNGDVPGCSILASRIGSPVVRTEPSTSPAGRGGRSRS